MGTECLKNVAVARAHPTRLEAPPWWTTRESNGSRGQRRGRHPGTGTNPEPGGRGRASDDRKEGREAKDRATTPRTSRRENRQKQAEERRKTAEEGATTPPGGRPGGGLKQHSGFDNSSRKTRDKNYGPDRTGEKGEGTGKRHDSCEKEAPGSYLPRARRAFQHSVQRAGVSGDFDGQFVDFAFPRVSRPSSLTGAVTP